MRLGIRDKLAKLRHAGTAIGAGLQPAADGGQIVATGCNGGFEGVAADAKARAHRDACVQARIRGSGRQNASALARRKARFVEQ